MALKYKLILASGSPRRVDLLNQAGIEPSRLMPMDIDEAPKKSEHPRSLARRLSGEKEQPKPGHDPGIVASPCPLAPRLALPAERHGPAGQARHRLPGRAGQCAGRFDGRSG